MFFQGNEKYNCATYLRLSRSDGDQQESNSIKNQRALLNDYIIRFSALCRLRAEYDSSHGDEKRKEVSILSLLYL